MEIETLGDLLIKQIPPRDYLIQDLIARKDFVIFSGPQKKGKSLLSLNLAICLARGEEWFGFPSKGKFRTGIVQQEIPEAFLKDRLLKMVVPFSDYQEFLQKIPHLTRSGLKIDDSAGRGQLRNWLDWAKVDLLIVDPLYQFHTGRENDAGDMAKVCQELQKLADIYNLAALLVHHHGKPGMVERTGGDLHRGASVLRDATDGNWTFTHVPPNKYVLDEESASYVTLSFELRHSHAPEPMLLYLNPETLWLERVEVQTKLDKDIEVLVDLLRNAGPLSTKALTVAFRKIAGKGERSAFNVVSVAAKKGMIVKDEKGQWRLK